MYIDVAIIGASTSGLCAAELLAREGVRVQVFERQPRLNPARRTLIVTPEFSRILGELPTNVVLHTINRLAIDCREATSVVKLNNPDLIVERSALALCLAERAHKAGADLIFNRRLKSIHERAQGLELHFDAGNGVLKRVTAGAVIGADGIFSDVGRLAGIPHPPVSPIVQAEIALPNDWDADTTKVWFNAEDTRFFYWLIPESETTGVIGLVGDDRTPTLDLLRRFMARHGLQSTAYQGARVAMHHPRLKPWTTIGGAPVCLVGDAAGQVKVTTVGGSVTGFQGASAAAHAILKGTSYAFESRSLKRELDLQWGIRLLLNQLDNRGYDRLIKALNPRVHNFLAEHNRDRMVPVIWQLLFEPGLVGIGLQAAARLAMSPIRQGLRQRTSAVSPKKKSIPPD